MLYVENNVINLNRGDDASLTIPLTMSTGEAYELGESEYLIFGVREFPTEESEILIEIQSDPGSNVIEFKHSDTTDIPVGVYSAEVQLMTEDGKRITVWPKLSGSQRTSKSNRKNFYLMTEVVRV